MTTQNIGKISMAMLAAATLVATMGSTGAVAQDKVQDQTRDRTQLTVRDPIYGSQLMTQAERNTHRATLRKMKTEQEREAYRLEHHKLMQERAAAKGITLPAVPPAGGAGPGSGLGGGAGGPGPKK
jgi:hypothetical protein